MKKIYLTLATALLGATTAFGQTTDYDIQLDLVTPASMSEVEVADSITISLTLTNKGTAKIEVELDPNTPDTVWLAYGKLNEADPSSTVTYAFGPTGQQGYVTPFLLPKAGLEPNQSVSVSNVTVGIGAKGFVAGDKIVVAFYGINGEPFEVTTYNDIVPTNNVDMFVLKASGNTPPPPACDIKGDNKVCKGAKLQLTGTPASQSWKVNPPGAATITPTGEVTGVTAGQTVTIEYSGSGCTGTAKHEVTINDCPNSGVDDFVNASINAYPNPATDILTIQSNETVESVSILSLDGKVLSTTYGSTVDVSALTSGVYLYRVTTKQGESAVSKFVKQ